MNACQPAEETQDDEGKYGGTKTHLDGTSLKRLIVSATDDDKKLYRNSGITFLANFVKNRSLC